MTTLPSRNSRLIPTSSRPSRQTGKPQRRRPVAESSTGPVKISPEGMFRLPSELIQVRPATERVRSVSVGLDPDRFGRPT